MSTNIHAEQKPLIYQIGKHVKLVDDATFCKSIIADGKELITGEEYGAIRVLELKDEKVYITFKEDLTSLANAFSGCSALKSIPEKLFANCPKVNSSFQTFALCKSLKSIPTGLFAHNPEVTDFSGTFSGCSALESISEKLFANNTKVTNFSYTFKNCSALTGESPYTMIEDQKVHLYERADYPEHFTTPTSTYQAFGNCTGLTDYAQIPTNWKE